jgi:hypothetical protein
VATKASSWKDPIKTAGAGAEGYIPSAFQSAGRLQQTMGCATLEAYEAVCGHLMLTYGCAVCCL